MRCCLEARARKVSPAATAGISSLTEDGGTALTTTNNRLLFSLATMLAGWVLALRALSQIGPWASLAGVAFLAVVGVGLVRAARI
jgi:putative Mn2+ efflux pump MntP